MRTVKEILDEQLIEFNNKILALKLGVFGKGEDGLKKAISYNLSDNRLSKVIKDEKEIINAIKRRIYND